MLLEEKNAPVFVVSELSAAYPLIVERDQGRKSLKTFCLPVQENSLTTGKDHTCSVVVEVPNETLTQ